LGEARGQVVLPSVKTINDLSRKAIYCLDTEELDYVLNQSLAHPDHRLMPVEFSLDIYFGTTDYTPLAPLARQIFETFPAPLMRVEFSREEDWKIGAIRVQNVSTLFDAQREQGRAALGAIARAPMPARAPVIPLSHRDPARPRGGARAQQPGRAEGIRRHGPQDGAGCHADRQEGFFAAG
jgi:hypothetical protein